MNYAVIARKANGKLRLCLDPKPLNKALQRCHFPYASVEDILRSWARARFLLKSIARMADEAYRREFPTYDLCHTLWQVQMESYMPFGIWPASKIFQLRFHEAVEGLEGTYRIADVILVARHWRHDEGCRCRS